MGYGIFAVSMLLVVLVDISPVWIVLGALAFGLILAWKGAKTP